MMEAPQPTRLCPSFTRALELEMYRCFALESDISDHFLAFIMGNVLRPPPLRHAKRTVHIDTAMR